MAKGCGCGGTPAVATTGAAPLFALQLPNGTKVGSYPTRSHAEIANATVYRNKGRIVER